LEADKESIVTINFNAFSFARLTLRKKGIECVNVDRELREGMSVQDFIDELGFESGEIEAAFVNGTVLPKSTILHDGDRVVLLPPGTPGSYRLILGIKAMSDEENTSG
jgi:sulfur carrier protein ThiS